jgi:hypothetical protein
LSLEVASTAREGAPHPVQNCCSGARVAPQIEHGSV